MGIPHLISTLQPYAEKVESRSIDRVVIDGPNFAYHIYKRVLYSQIVERGAKKLVNVPTYSDVNQEAIRWLDQKLGADTNEVEAILFDAGLPDEKVKVRRDRMITQIAALTRFRSAKKPMIEGM
jgi:hypothetical protein